MENGKRWRERETGRDGERGKQEEMERKGNGKRWRERATQRNQERLIGRWE